MNKADIYGVKGHNPAFLEILWTDGSPCCSPIVQGPKQVCLILPPVEEFKKLEGKDGYEKADIQSPGTAVLQDNHAKDQSRLETHSHMNLGKMVRGCRRDFLGLLDMGSPYTVIPKPVTTGLGGYRNAASG